MSVSTQAQKFGEAEYAKGLEGVIATESKIGYVDGQAGRLVYRGLDIQDLAEHSHYEEVAYLLLYGKLPTKAELDGFDKELKAHRAVPKEVIDVLKQLPKDTHPMSALRTGVSALGCFDADAEKTDVPTYNKIGVKLIAQIATICGAFARIRKGLAPLDPDPNLGHTANFLYMATGQKPEPLAEKVMDCSMILHADHGMNASTFTSMVVISSLTDFYSSITAAIGSLKGPLHGGANEHVMRMILEIGSEDKVAAYLDDKIANKVKVMGFGHRVYKVYDPRATVLKKYSQEVTELRGQGNYYKIAKKVEDYLLEDKGYAAKGIYPNVDFYSGTVYYALGYDYELFTPIFAVSRIAGWVARCLEYLPENRIFRPRAVYKGDRDLHYVPMADRK